MLQNEAFNNIKGSGSKLVYFLSFEGGLNELQKMKPERFKTTLYMNLLWIVFFWNIIYPYRSFQSLKEHRLISLFKSINSLVDNARIIRQILRKSKIQMGKSIRKIYNVFSKGHWLEKRKNSYSFENIYAIFILKSNNY